MKVDKQLIVKIELAGDEVMHFIDALQDIMAAENAVNQGLGYLKREQRKILEEIISEINSTRNEGK